MVQQQQVRGKKINKIEKSRGAWDGKESHVSLGVWKLSCDDEENQLALNLVGGWVAASDLLFGAGWDAVWPKALYAGWDLVLGGWDAVWGVVVCFVFVDLLPCAYKEGCTSYTHMKYKRKWI